MHTPHPAPPLLEVVSLVKHYGKGGGLLRRGPPPLPAVNQVSFRLNPGETLGLVGESGCGKTTTARAIMGLTEISGGDVFLDGQSVRSASAATRRALRLRMQMVFQDPYASLNPRMTAGNIVAEPMRNAGWDRARIHARTAELFARVGLRPDQTDRLPRAFSGGQRQRLGIARALALQPQVLICDEPVSALDVSVQAQVLNLFQDLQRDMGLAMLFVTHDMGVVGHIAQRIAVMYAGQIVEIGPRADVLGRPRHPYTRALLSAIPREHPDRPRPRLALRPGEMVFAGTGCAFAARCPRASDLCRSTRPAPTGAAGGHEAACHYT